MSELPNESTVEEPVIDESETVEPVEEPKQEPKTFDESYVRKLREEAAARRIREKELQAKLQEYENEKLTESERLQKELEELRTSNVQNLTRAQEATINYQLALAAADPKNELGDVKAAIKLIDRDALEFDDKGNIANLHDALEVLKSEYPSVRATSPRPGAPNTGSTNPPKTSTAKRYTRADLKTMSPEKIVELQESGQLNHILGGRS